MKSAQVIFIKSLLCLTMSFLVSCQKTTKSDDEEFYLQIEMKIIPYSDVSSQWDSTYYHHDTTWTGWENDTMKVDSLVEILAASGLPVTDVWYPQEPSHCLMMFLNGVHFIVKLSKPDSLMVEYGFEPQANFPLYCVPTWRHYTFVQVSQGG